MLRYILVPYTDEAFGLYAFDDGGLGSTATQMLRYIPIPCRDKIARQYAFYDDRSKITPPYISRYILAPDTYNAFRLYAFDDVESGFPTSQMLICIPALCRHEASHQYVKANVA